MPTAPIPVTAINCPRDRLGGGGNLPSTISIAAAHSPVW
jgi:bifunctional ADP-heptose synthase (sugar kinase/adenylyltransferase)